MSLPYHEVDLVRVDPQAAVVYAEGWQSWSPTRAYRAGDIQPVPADSRVAAIGYRADQLAQPGTIQGEGLLALDPAVGEPVRVYSDQAEVPSLRVVAAGHGLLRVEATSDVTCQLLPGTVAEALASWGDGLGIQPRPAPTVWCSWYHYFTGVTAADIDENLQQMASLELPIEVVQVDDGYAAEIGDWLTPSSRFPDLPGLAARIRAAGRRAGIWVAPFLVGARSALAREHPDWLVADAWAGRNWDQDLLVLDVTHPQAAAHLTSVFEQLRGYGFDYFKIDFCYAGALRGRWHEPAEGPAPQIAAYRHGLQLLRQAIGDESYLLGCGAPTMASVGMVDAMRISPDTALHRHASDPSAPGQSAAIANGVARAWQHGRLWVNDPDCLVARPAVEDRQGWAAHVRRYGGLRSASDRLADLDDWGLATTRELLGNVPPPTPFRPEPQA